MPGRDGTGPQGQGAMSGRGRGLVERRQNVNAIQGQRSGLELRRGFGPQPDSEIDQGGGPGLGRGHKRGKGRNGGRRSC